MIDVRYPIPIHSFTFVIAIYTPWTFHSALHSSAYSQFARPEGPVSVVFIRRWGCRRGVNSRNSIARGRLTNSRSAKASSGICLAFRLPCTSACASAHSLTSFFFSSFPCPPPSKVVVVTVGTRPRKLTLTLTLPCSHPTTHSHSCSVVPNESEKLPVAPGFGH